MGFNGFEASHSLTVVVDHRQRRLASEPSELCPNILDISSRLALLRGERVAKQCLSVCGVIPRQTEFLVKSRSDPTSSVAQSKRRIQVSG